MPKPDAVAAVVTGTPTASSWANDVADGINAIIADIYAAGGAGASLAIPWAKLTGVPSTFTPTAHAHDWADVTGEPTTFAPTVHDHSAGAGGGNVPWANVSGKPSTFTPATHASSHLTGGADALTASGVGGFDRVAAGGTIGTKIFVGTGTPSSPAEGDIWVKG